MIQSILEMAGQYGVPVALVIFFIWRDYERERMMNARTAELEAHIASLEKEMRTLLMDLVSKTSQIIVSNSESMRDWLEVLKIRPCLADELARKILDETREIKHG